MNALSTAIENTNDSWVFAKSLIKLEKATKLLVRIAGKQIALFDTPNGVRACDNRCPHEGFPLSQGSLSDTCTLTCNWHNWKFDLDTGENLFGGDSLRIYPTELRGDEIWINLAERTYAERHATIMENLLHAFDDHSYDRIAREIARLIHIGGDPLEALRCTILWSWKKFEFGWTHAYAGMADWLILYDENQGNDELQLVSLVESVAHTAFDVLREREYPFSNKIATFDEDAFIHAIEQENEVTATAMVRGALRDGLQFDDLERAFTHAALAHYNDFGHSLIYVTKARILINRLGQQIAKPLLLSLVRSLVFARREDKIPEFKNYTPTLTAWKQGGNVTPKARNWQQKSIDKALKITLASSHSRPETLYKELLQANAINLLSFDINQQYKVYTTVSGNVGWLDFTHGVTFANAVRKQCKKFPELWPQGLLQMACFCGRNAAFTTPEFDLIAWQSANTDDDIQKILDRVLDHGQGEYIISVHWLKLALAVREEIAELPIESGKTLIAALNRFINSPLKRRQARRIAHQSIQIAIRN